MSDDREIYLMPRVAESAFPALFDLMAGEGDFPPTYPTWMALWAKRRLEEERDHGFRVVFVDVVPAALKAFLQKRDSHGSWDALGHFIAVLAEQ
jgi:hypothetical protein